MGESISGGLSLISLASVTTTGDDSEAIRATSFSGNIGVFSSGIVTTLGESSHGIYAATAGDIAIGNEVSPVVLLYTGEVLMTHRPPQLFDPGNLAWRSTMDFVQGDRMPNGDHSDHELQLLPDGRVAAIGYKTFNLSVGRMLEIYDPEYYVAFTFVKDTPIAVVGNAGGCMAAYHQPHELDQQTMAALAAIPQDERELPPELEDAALGLAHTFTLKCE